MKFWWGGALFQSQGKRRCRGIDAEGNFKGRVCKCFLEEVTLSRDLTVRGETDTLFAAGGGGCDSAREDSRDPDPGEEDMTCARGKRISEIPGEQTEV